MLANAQAEVWAVEQNPLAYLKCLLVRELFSEVFEDEDTGRSKLTLVHAVSLEFLKNYPNQFQIALASGVLYHQENPAELIAQLAEHCRTIFIWTHYYSADHFRVKEFTPVKLQARDFHYTGYQLPYATRAHIGGSKSFANWMTLPDLAACLSHFGYSIRETNFDEPNHPHGPAIAMIVDRV